MHIVEFLKGINKKLDGWLAIVQRLSAFSNKPANNSNLQPGRWRWQDRTYLESVTFASHRRTAGHSDYRERGRGFRRAGL